MVNVAILYPKGCKKIVSRIVYDCTSFISNHFREVGLYDGYRKYEIIQQQLNKKSKLIKDFIWIKENTMNKNHIIFTLRNDISDPLIHLGIILTCRISHKIILICSTKNNLKEQLDYFSKILTPKTIEIYLLIDGYSHYHQE